MLRHVLRATLAVTGALCCIGVAQADFTIVSLPDTQYYTHQVNGGTMAMFHAQTQWIVDNHVQQNIVFVMHEGDITDLNSPIAPPPPAPQGLPEWQRANEAMSRLDGVVPYILSLGNHDIGPNGTAANRDSTNYNLTFPASRFENEPWYGGRMPNDGNDNYYVYFTADGMDFMIISIEFGADDATLAWANQVVSANPNRRVIVLTHCYMNFDDTRVGPNDPHHPHSYGIEFLGGGANDGEQMWDEFVKLHPNIFWVQSGHVFDPNILTDGMGRLMSTGTQGNPTEQICADYQFAGQGGRGLMRVMHFMSEQDLVTVETFSPWNGEHLTDPENQFSFFYDMTAGPNPPPPATLRLRRPEHCFQPGDTFPVALWIADLGSYQAAGYQAFLHFNPTQLSLVGGSYSSTPFGTHLITPITSSKDGQIGLASGVDFDQDQQPTSADSLLATFTFQVLTPQTIPNITFDTHVPPTTIADTTGAAIPHVEINEVATRADLNLDGRVNSLDLGILLSSWSIPATAPGCSGGHACLPDVNCDGRVNSLDLGVLLSSWTL